MVIRRIRIRGRKSRSVNMFFQRAFWNNNLPGAKKRVNKKEAGMRRNQTLWGSGFRLDQYPSLVVRN